MRDVLIAGNFKMHKTSIEVREYARELLRGLKGLELGGEKGERKGVRKEVLLCPSYPTLYVLYEELKGSNVLYGAQNVHNEEQGAYTGEVSVSMLKSLGCTHVILGHSERRHILGESDKFINLKVLKALKSGLKIILCVGEKLEERERGLAYEVVQSQLEEGLMGVDSFAGRDVIIAYEPVWAIGTGKTANPSDAEKMHKHIRVVLEDKLGKEISDSLIIQYGGSVKPETISELMSMQNIDGVLVGGACLDPKSFLKIIEGS